MDRKWVRWQDWVAFAAGLVTALTPIWAAPDEARGTWALVVLGVLLAAGALWSLAVPEAVLSEWTHVVLGVLLFVSPWVFGFQDVAVAAWTAWIAGVLAVAAGLWVALPQVQSRRSAHA
ncbi:apolipoprotein N-acyltransferase [Thermocatellispora tengchongensis]|uniref:Apolipoprotein N-acyltransferase n=1 Tax=Thermocatellispora tengchongensis TaxID=1073253 RepID=A0A840PTJ4_9ACTN|nr:SPW repeat protein [Thermocatellispora tengchongensis]MBB5139245.1 apolipoprotein N-acyltransferase [Thermocatellispora tengchongensis]